MKIAIMQPYFLPYIGYFQLINAVDKFVVYDNIEYTKKGWINRNRILQNNSPIYMSIPLKKSSDFFNINERQLSDEWIRIRVKLLGQIHGAYRSAPYFREVYPIIEDLFYQPEKNLFLFILKTIDGIKSFLNIKSELIISSTLDINHNLRGRNKVIEICKYLGATSYFNSIGGKSLYDKKEFRKHKINLTFLETQGINYQQFGDEFHPFLSILDVLMFNSKENTKAFLEKYTLV